MESRAKLLGHPIHPILIVFPLGLLFTAVIFDIIYLVTRTPRWAEASFLMIAAGIIGGAVSALAGVVDWFGIPHRTRAKAIGIRHGFGNLIALVLFAMSWFVRFGTPDAPTPLAVALSVVGAAVLGVTGWLGGELVDRLGVGVDDGAHLNAPSSLSGRSAREEAGTATTGRQVTP